jgi:hypothetical protein
MLACERPTAPQVRDAADQVERKILSGDSTEVYGGAMTLLGLSAVYDTSRLLPSDTIRIIRGDQKLLLHATVMERAYLPPAGSDARPIIDRMAVAWSADATHDRHRMRLVMLLTRDSVPLISTSGPDDPNPGRWEDLYKHWTRAVNIEPGDRHEWNARGGGSLTISDGVPVASCPFAGDVARSPVFPSGLPHTTAPITCDTRRYTISLSATMDHDDLDQSIIELRIPRQETRGVRIMTQCTGVREADPDECWGFAKPDPRH